MFKKQNLDLWYKWFQIYSNADRVIYIKDTIMDVTYVVDGALKDEYTLSIILGKFHSIDHKEDLMTLREGIKPKELSRLIVDFKYHIHLGETLDQDFYSKYIEKEFIQPAEELVFSSRENLRTEIDWSLNDYK